MLLRRFAHCHTLPPDHTHWSVLSLVTPTSRKMDPIRSYRRLRLSTRDYTTPLMPIGNRSIRDFSELLFGASQRFDGGLAPLQLRSYILYYYDLILCNEGTCHP